MKLALVGSKITHSRSPEVYQKLLGNKLTSYDLLDYDDISFVPKAHELCTKYDGINITSPYKKYFLNEVEIRNCPGDIPGVNCMVKSKKGIIATNTDYLAVSEIAQGLYKIQPMKFVILGDGVMSQVTELVLQSLNYDYEIKSRSKTKCFDQLIFENCIVINACSRDYVFSGEILSNVIFWDYNYNFIPHQTSLPSVCKIYIDGYSLLELQAKFAISFWESVTP
jgi:shikimate 5-dehydrogenase